MVGIDGAGRNGMAGIGRDGGNGIRQELKIQMVLQVTSGLFPIQWQCRLKSLVSMLNKNYIQVLFISL